MNGNFRYKSNFIRKITLAKVFNSAVLYLTYHLSRISGRNIHAGFPISIAIEPTTACNLRCPECPSGLRAFTRPTGNLKMNGFTGLIDQLKKTTSFLTFYFQGEPYLNPEFLDMVSYASGNGLITSTSTNAHFLDEENSRKTVESGLDRLIISIDGADQKSYESYRKEGSLEKVLDGTRNIIKWKKKLKSSSPQVVFQFLVVKPNEHQMNSIKLLAKEIGVDKVIFKSAQIYEYQNGSELIPDNVQYSRYKKNSDGTWTIKNKLLNQCWRMWSSCVVTWDGNVVPCCFDKDAKYKVGNAFSTSFTEIWRGVEINKFRQALLKGRSEIDICTNCSEGTKVWV